MDFPPLLIDTRVSVLNVIYLLQIKGATTNKNGKNFKCNQCAQVFINTVEMGRHKKSAHSGRNNIKRVVSAFSANIEYTEQKYRSTIITTADYETEFYKNVCSNVKLVFAR